MWINGKKIEGANEEIIPIPRGNGEDIILIVRAILDMEPFEKMCPPPTPPVRKIEGVDIPQLRDPNYVKAVTKYAEKRMAYMVITSLEATEGLEWEQVDVNDPSTWPLFRKEMTEAGFSDVEVSRVIAGVTSVNALSEVKIQAARERFLLSKQVQLKDSLSQKED